MRKNVVAADRENMQNWDRKVKNREYSKSNFWVYCRELHANAKFKMADY